MRAALLCLCLFSVSCVTQGTYDELKADHDKTLKELNDLRSTLSAEELKARELAAKASKLDADLSATQKDKSALEQDKSSLEASNAEMKKALEELRKRK